MIKHNDVNVGNVKKKTVESYYLRVFSLLRLGQTKIWKVARQNACAR